MSGPAAGAGPVFYTPAETAARLKVSQDWLEKEARAGRVPHCKFGRFRRFSDAHIAEIIEMTERAARGPRGNPAPRIPARRRQPGANLRVAG